MAEEEREVGLGRFVNSFGIGRGVIVHDEGTTTVYELRLLLHDSSEFRCFLTMKQRDVLATGLLQIDVPVDDDDEDEWEEYRIVEDD